MTKQDRQLAIAALALYQAVLDGCVPDELDSDRDHADLCIHTVTKYMEGFPYSGPDDPDALRTYVYQLLDIPTDD